VKTHVNTTTVLTVVISDAFLFYLRTTKQLEQPALCAVLCCA